jgi:hypothetical protein
MGSCMPRSELRQWFQVIIALLPALFIIVSPLIIPSNLSIKYTLEEQALRNRLAPLHHVSGASRSIRAF